jgi:membrane-associated HD superfamily phosphohydrolase
LTDHQLDECPVTFSEIRELKRVFSGVILSMMHSRISYNLSNGSNGKTEFDADDVND